VHADFQEIERALAALERDFEAALHRCHHHHGGGDQAPASIRLTVQ